MIVRNKLKEIRIKEYMMNQIEFCDEVLKISVRAYSPIENNEVQGNLEIALRIAKALDKYLEEIWYFADGKDMRSIKPA